MSRQHHNPGQPPPPTCPALKSVALGYHRIDAGVGKIGLLSGYVPELKVNAPLRRRPAQGSLHIRAGSIAMSLVPRP